MKYLQQGGFSVNLGGALFRKGYDAIDWGHGKKDPTSESKEDAEKGENDESEKANDGLERVR